MRIWVEILWNLSSIDGSVDLGGADEKEPGIEIGLGLFDLFILRWAKHKKPGDIERTL